MSTESNNKKLTDWEIGQELTKVFDTINESRVEIKSTSPLIAHELAKIANKVGHIFNKLKSHGFLLPEDLKWPQKINLKKYL